MPKRVALAGLSFAFLVACGHEAAPPASTAAAPPTASTVSAVSAAGPGAPSATTWDAAKYRATIDEALEAMFVANPVWATRVGEHRFDEQWPDLSADAQAKIAADFHVRGEGLRAVAKSVPQVALVTDAGTDRPALDAEVLAERLEALSYQLSVLRALERDPSSALGVIGSGVTGLVDHDYAPKHTRMNALATRLSRVPALLTTARARLVKPSRAGLENLAIVAKGLSGMLRGAIANEAPKDVGDDAPLRDRLKKGATDAAAAIESYAAEVAKAYPVTAATDEPIGAEKWGNLARLGEGVTESPSEVRKMGEAELLRLQGELDALLAQSGKKGETRAAFYKRLESDTPEADKVLDAYRSANKGVEEWMHSHPFVTVPWDKAKLEIVPTPPHMRGISFASMNVAGMLEPVISDARFEVNAPEPSTPKERQAALLHFHAHGAIEMVSVHEAIPGHYLQYLFARQTPSKVRKITGASTFTEGWAHYCEQAILEAGYTGPDAARTRAFYLRMALQRAVRVVVDVAENDGSMTVEQGAKFLADNAMLAPEAAKIEARRAVVWPANMFSYTYGKLTILKLREEAKAREGAAFDLVKFHDRLLSVGFMPIKYVGAVAFGSR
jgi:uncharacterized protein (DUF885 family)